MLEHLISENTKSISMSFVALLRSHNVDLVVCVAAGLRRGIKEEILAEGFRISGLGQMIELGMVADRTVVFGD